jgi:cysteine synthase
MTRKLSTEQGLYVGYSSGANVIAALKYATPCPEIKNIATILCDTGYKYSDL